MAERKKEKTAIELSTADEGPEEVDAEVGLVEEDVLKIYNLEWFLLALQQRFEDPLVEGKAWGKLQHLWQGNCSVSEFVTDFSRLASRLRGWPELVLVQLFKDTLHPKVLQWALIHGNPEPLMGWIRQAGAAEMRIWQLEQLEHQLNCAQRQPLRMPEKAVDNEKTWAGPSKSAHAPSPFGPMPALWRRQPPHCILPCSLHPSSCFRNQGAAAFGNPQESYQ
uniref:Uncharacterized protein n=1 Tax=Sphaerodactylus townsendi TaxID=933632 RepID=A0ACB8EBN2_9SAUR